MSKNLLITGPPGVGKTTLVKSLCKALASRKPVGFYTEEIREEGVRRGFRLIALDGRTGILSHSAIKSPFRVGKYGVDVAGFEQFLDSLDLLGSADDLVIMDEIGKMECKSEKFRKLLSEVLDSERQLVATIALKGDGIIEQTKRRMDTTLLEMTAENRDSLLSDVLEALGSPMVRLRTVTGQLNPRGD